MTVRVSVSGNSDVTVEPTSLSFTASDWSQAQTVTVSAARDDDTVDDTATLNHSASGADYGGVRALPLAAMVTDNSDRGVTLSTTNLALREGDSATYTVVLDTQPSGTVTVAPRIDGSGGEVAVSPSLLTFTASNWKTPQRVTVSAGHDGDEEPDTATVEHHVSGADYGEAGVTAGTVEVSVSDDDIASTEIRLSLSADSVREGGGAQRLTVTAELNGDDRDEDTVVTLTPAVAGQTPGDASEDDFAADPATLTIRPGQVRATAQVTIRPVQDRIDEGEGERLEIGATTPSGLRLAPDSFYVTIEDDDERGLVFSRPALTVPEERSATYTVRLASQPTGPVTVTIVRDGDPDVAMTPRELTFDANNWNTARTVTVSAGDDTDGDDDAATLTHTVNGGGYNLTSVLTVTVDDNDRPSRNVTLTLDPVQVDEGGTSSVLRITATLDGATRATPTNVVVSVTGGTAMVVEDFTDPGSITIPIPAGAISAETPVNFTTVDDDSDEGLSETVIFGGTAPAGLSVRTATLTIADDDGKGIVLSPGPVTLNEEGTGTYTVALNTEPRDVVTVRVSVSGNSDVTVEPTSLTFTASRTGARRSR